MDWTTDPRMLAAGNARGIDGGDPDSMPVSPAGPRAISRERLLELRAAALVDSSFPARHRKRNVFVRLARRITYRSN